MESRFSELLNSFEKKSLEFEKIDNNDHVWKFELESFSMREYIYFRYFINKLRRTG